MYGAYVWAVHGPPVPDAAWLAFAGRLAAKLAGVASNLAPSQVAAVDGLLRSPDRRGCAPSQRSPRPSRTTGQVLLMGESWNGELDLSDEPSALIYFRRIGLMPLPGSLDPASLTFRVRPFGRTGWKAPLTADEGRPAGTSPERPSAYRGRRRPVCRSGRSGTCGRSADEKSTACRRIRPDPGEVAGSTDGHPYAGRNRRTAPAEGRSTREGKCIVTVDLNGLAAPFAGIIEYRHLRRALPPRDSPRCAAGGQAARPGRSERCAAAPAFKQADM